MTNQSNQFFLSIKTKALLELLQCISQRGGVLNAYFKTKGHYLRPILKSLVKVRPCIVKLFFP